MGRCIRCQKIFFFFFHGNGYVYMHKSLQSLPWLVGNSKSIVYMDTKLNELMVTYVHVASV